MTGAAPPPSSVLANARPLIGESPVDYRVPPLLDFPAFTIFSTNYPAFKMFMLLVSVAIFLGLLIAFKKTRVGLIVQAALSHPHMVGHLGSPARLTYRMRRPQRWLEVRHAVQGRRCLEFPSRNPAPRRRLVR